MVDNIFLRYITVLFEGKWTKSIMCPFELNIRPLLLHFKNYLYVLFRFSMYPNKIYYSYFKYILTSEYNQIYEIYGSISNFKSFSLRRKIAYEICVQEGYQNLTRISSKIYENSFLIWQGKLLQICNGSYLTVKMFPIDKSLNFCQHNALNTLNHLWLLNLFIT